MAVALDDLRRIQLFAGLSAASLARLADIASVSAYGDGQAVLWEGEEAAAAMFVLDGAVRVYHTSPEGREQTLILLQAGDALNLPMPFSPLLLSPASAVAVGDARLLAVPLAAFRSAASETPDLALAVMGDLSAKLRHFTRLTYDLSLRSVRGRLARFLLRHASSATPSPVRWTQEEVAAQLGTVREVVSRTLRAFVREGLIRLDRQRILILDREALERESES